MYQNNMENLKSISNVRSKSKVTRRNAGLAWNKCLSNGRIHPYNGHQLSKIKQVTYSDKKQYQHHQKFSFVLKWDTWFNFHYCMYLNFIKLFCYDFGNLEFRDSANSETTIPEWGCIRLSDVFLYKLN